MAGNTLNVDTDFHTSALTSVDTAVCRLCRYYEFRTNFVFVDDVLPAKAITVFFLNRTNNHDLVTFRNQVVIFHDLSAVNSRYNTAALVRYTTATDFCFVLITIIWIECPVVDVADTYCIDMTVESDDLVTCTHVTDDVALWIDDNFVEVQFLHLSSNCLYMRLFITAFARILNDGT